MTLPDGWARLRALVDAYRTQPLTTDDTEQLLAALERKLEAMVTNHNGVLVIRLSRRRPSMGDTG